MNYRGYFNSLDCTEYCVSFKADSGNSWTEVNLDAANPITISYPSGDILFQPSKISTATISVITDDYLTDLFTPYAQGVSVEVKNLTDNSIVWKGYLKPQIYNQSYENCVENIEFEASDCLASLQYLDYKTVGTKKRIVTFKDIIDQACDMAGVDGYYWGRAKRMNTNVLLPEHMTISEQNFYSNDTDEPWKYSDVLDEMCRYLGLTLLQWGNYFYFLDMQTFHTEEAMEMSRYDKTASYSATVITLQSALTITEDVYKGNSHNISYAPIYNKAAVKANFYFPEFFIPDIDKDDYRTNRYGGSKLQQIEYENNTIRFNEAKFTGDTAYTPVYIYKGKQKHDADDSKYVYYRKLIDHEYYSPVYYNQDLTTATPPETALTSTGITKNYISGQLVEFGHTERGNEEDTSYEVASSLSLNKYLLIHQWDQPEYRTSTELQFYVNDYPCVFKLNSGFTNPIIVDSGNSYLCLFADAMFERYEKRDYFNPDWTNDPSEVGTSMWPAGYPGISKNLRPFLNFKLGIGNKYWSGEAWSTYETNFWVKARTEEKNEDPELMDPSNWNTDRETLNNIPFTDWTGADGYKIPLTNSLDMNGEITFCVNMPAKLAYLWLWDEPLSALTSGQNHWCWMKDIKLTIHNKMTDEVKDSDIVYGGEEEGVIDDKSIMELGEITCKITTFPGNNKLSYSNVGDAVKGGFLTGITEPSLIVSYVSQKPELNNLTRLINQYSSQTIKEELTVDLEAVPYRKVYDEYWGSGKHFVWDGAAINLKEGRQTITIVETK